jgi:hypothetical protein
MLTLPSDLFTPEERNHTTYCVGGWVGPEQVWALWQKEKLSSARNRIPAIQPPSLVTILTEDPRPRCKFTHWSQTGKRGTGKPETELREVFCKTVEEPEEKVLK